MFLLPNNIKIDEDGIIKGFNNADISHKYYLDIITGQVGCVTDNKENKVVDKNRYFRVPKISEKTKKKWMGEFIKEIVYPEDKFLAGLFAKALKKNMDYCFKLLEKTDDIHGWAQWEHDYMQDEMMDWFDTLPVVIKDDWELDDDCALCQLMKQGEHTVNDFKKAALKMPDWRIEEKDRKKDKNNLYYDAMELLDGSKSGAKKALEMLSVALEIDRDYVQTYIGFAQAYGELVDKNKAREHIKKAFKLTQKKFPTWPKELHWGVLENRAYLRAIQFMADDCADLGKKSEAEKLYRLLLKLNPGDNQGVRYTLAGLYAGISGEKINNMFDEGNRKQNCDKLQDLVKEQNKKHRFWKEPKYN